MKQLTIFYFVLLCLWLSPERFYAQSQSVDERFIEAMSALDMTPVISGTGIFLDKVPTIVPLHIFNGKVLSDTF